MVYHPVRCALSDHQRKRLSHGGVVALKKAQLGHGDHIMHLTSHQYNRMHKEHGGGIRLHFSGAQLKHNVKHGKGFLSFFKNVGNKIADTAKSSLPALKQIAQLGLKVGTPLLTKAAASALNSYAPGLGTVAGPLLDQAGEYGANAASDAIGSGIRKKRAYHRKGKGLYLPGGGAGGGGRGNGGGILAPSIRGVHSTPSGVS